MSYSVVQRRVGLFFLAGFCNTLFQHGLQAIADAADANDPPPGEAGGLAGRDFWRTDDLVRHPDRYADRHSPPARMAEYGSRKLAPTTGSSTTSRHRPVNRHRSVRLRTSVVKFKHFASWAGGIALSLIRYPGSGVRTTGEHAQTGIQYARETASALEHRNGRWSASSPCVLRAGVLTGILLAVRISVKPAPLLFTALEQPVLECQHEPADNNLPWSFSSSP